MSFDQIINADKGTTIWDFFNGVLDFIEGLVDNIIYLVVPDDTSFLQSALASIKSSIDDKFGNVSFLQSFFVSAFDVDQKKFEKDFTIDMDWMGVGTVKIMDVSFLNDFLPTFRNFMAGFFYFATAIWSYKKLTNGVIT